MRKSSSTSSPLVPISTVTGTGTVVAAAAAMCPPLLPLAWLTAPLFYHVTKKGIESEVDAVASENADRAASEWLRTRKPGETGIDVSQTLYSDGALFDLPMTRTYHYRLDDDD